jgi:hypothetical protein
MTTSENLARLMQLRDQANDSLFERLHAAKEVLADREWVNTHFLSDAEAKEHLRDIYFPQIAGMLSPAQLFELIERFPDRKVWEQYKFNLRVMLDLLKPEREPRIASSGPTKSELRDRVAELEVENAKLRAELAEVKADLRLAAA